MIAEKFHPLTQKLRVLIVAVAASTFSVGLVRAQDFEAVERKLGEAIGDGDLSLEHAQIMMDALRRTVESRRPDMAERHYRHLVDEVEAALESGRISEEEAEKKIIAAQHRMMEGRRERERGMEAKERHFGHLVEEIEAAVESGELSEKDAEKKINAVRREMFGEHRDPEHAMEAKEDRFRQIAEEIEAAVDSGKLNWKDAEKKINAVRREMFGDRHDRDKESKERR